jgi:hypothetical protein
LIFTVTPVLADYGKGTVGAKRRPEEASISMTQEALAIGAGVVMSCWAWGAFLPPSVNPLRLKKRYEKHATPGLADSIPRLAGIGFVLLGIVLVATAVVQSMS